MAATRTRSKPSESVARRRKPTTGARPSRTPPASRSVVEVVHQITVGQTLVENVDGHAARTDSPQFTAARRTLHKIVKTLTPNPFGPGPIESHHGGSIWVHGGAGEGDWRLLLNWAGIEWSAQFCCDPAKVELLRQNAEAITAAFPATLPELGRLGYRDGAILSTPITDATGVAHYVDSIWNACVPIPKARHTGSLKAASPLACGVHNYPEPMCGIPRVMRDDFVPFVVDKDTKTAAVVAPVAPRHSGDGRVRVLFAEKGNPLHDVHRHAHDAGAAVVLGPDHPVAKAAFAKQRR